MSRRLVTRVCHSNRSLRLLHFVTITSYRAELGCLPVARLREKQFIIVVDDSSETMSHRRPSYILQELQVSKLIIKRSFIYFFLPDTCKTQPSPFPPMKTSNPSFPSSSCSSSITHASTPRPLSLTPAHPPYLTSKGRPMSAKGRPRSGSYIATEIKSGFSLKVPD